MLLLSATIWLSSIFNWTPRQTIVYTHKSSALKPHNVPAFYTKITTNEQVKVYSKWKSIKIDRTRKTRMGREGEKIGPIKNAKNNTYIWTMFGCRLWWTETENRATANNSVCTSTRTRCMTARCHKTPNSNRTYTLTVHIIAFVVYILYSAALLLLLLLQLKLIFTQPSTAHIEIEI